jgi:hypothetical protein
MAYTNNIPQGNQQIATTQPLIQANFGFIQTDLQVEHQFNGNVSGLAEGVHLRASMPNQADPVVLPAGTNGIYYVSGGAPKFYNGTAFQIQYTGLFQNAAAGSVALSTSVANVFTVPAFSSGYYFLIPPTAISANSASAMGQFITGNTTLQLGTVSDPGISLSVSGRTIRAATTSGSLNGTYKYVVIYFTP